ncbi:hypothetical protein B7494_g3196 [Chlorociboria aeruginascens]|nr:hypothetical protein B7494_g3196 [Chlorociboria aeruginascens]
MFESSVWEALTSAAKSAVNGRRRPHGSLQSYPNRGQLLPDQEHEAKGGDMHLQTASTTTTMAYPSLPASPTLTNPDMILPYGEYDSTPSPSNSSSPEKTWKEPADMDFSLGPPHAPIGPVTPTTPIIYGNGTMLSDIGEVTEGESTPGRGFPTPAERRLLKQSQNPAMLRSSPTLGYNAVMKRTRQGTHERKISVESTSTVTSEPHAAELFGDFDDGVSVDDSNFQGDDEESVADSYSEQVIAMETQRLSRIEESLKDEDRNSSAALSRRAEQILSNAKRRLNNMEGNLNRARSSLYVSPSNSRSSLHSSSPLTRSTPSPPTDRRVMPQLGMTPSSHRKLNTPSDSPLGSPGHSRVFSENSLPSKVRSTPFPVRSSSGLARYNDQIGMEPSNKQSPEQSQPQEKIPEERESLASSGPPSPVGRKLLNPAVQFEPLSEDETRSFAGSRASVRSGTDGWLSPSGEHRTLSRSTSTMQMRDLKDQMQDLKGRLSVLRDRARDDTMRRRSLQSLRTPSPFTAAEQWYTGAKGYKEGGLSTDMGAPQTLWSEQIGIEPKSTEKLEVTTEATTLDTPEYARSEVMSIYEDVSEGQDGIDSSDDQKAVLESNDNTAIEGDLNNEDPQDPDDYKDELVNRDELDDYDEDAESDGTQYHDTFTTLISHEDREDAFDYEHFFLHSAMGTMSQQKNRRRDSRGSYSSEDSVETTRGPTTNTTKSPIKADPRTSSGHFRSQSAGSVSTMATFATASEGFGSDRNSDYDNYAVQHVFVPPQPRSTTPLTAKRSTFGPIDNNLPKDGKTPITKESRPSSVIAPRDYGALNRPSVASFDSIDSNGSTGTTRSFPLVNKAKSQQPNSGSKGQNGSVRSDPASLIEAHNLQSSPVHMLGRDDQVLVERLVESLGKCVLGLQESGSMTYESRVWRRRLDAARRVLEGQEGAI